MRGAEAPLSDVSRAAACPSGVVRHVCAAGYAESVTDPHKEGFLAGKRREKRLDTPDETILGNPRNRLETNGG
jgi:hypothetical protein